MTDVVRKLYPVSDVAQFVAWALRVSKQVRMVRTPTAALVPVEHGYVNEKRVRIDYAFDAMSGAVEGTWYYTEVCQVRSDGEILFPEGSPYPSLRDAGHEVVVTHPRGGTI